MPAVRANGTLRCLTFRTPFLMEKGDGPLGVCWGTLLRLGWIYDRQGRSDRLGAFGGRRELPYKDGRDPQETHFHEHTANICWACLWQAAPGHSFKSIFPIHHPGLSDAGRPRGGPAQPETALAGSSWLRTSPGLKLRSELYSNFLRLQLSMGEAWQAECGYLLFFSLSS